MADIPQQDTIVQRVVTGSPQTDFAFAFYAPKETDIQVYKQHDINSIPNPTNDILVLDEDYTITFNNNPYLGGTVTLLVAAEVNNVVTIVRDVQASLNVEFSNARSFSGATLDEALERLLLITQQNKTYAFQRNLSYVVNSYLGITPGAITANTQIPKLDIGEIWIGTAGGVINVLLEENPDISTLRGELANAQAFVNGAGLVGYYDINASASTTVRAYLNYNKIFGTASGTANALTLTIASSDEIVYVAGMEVKLLISTSNSGASTLNINSLGTKNIITATGSSVSAGEMVAGKVAELIYDGTNFRLLNPIASSSVPSGTILDYAGTAAPSGYLVCDGSTQLRSAYPQLFAILGTTWGAGDGSTNFVLPNMQRRVTVGSGGVASPYVNVGTTVGSIGGEEAHQLTIPELASHNHALNMTMNNVGNAGTSVLSNGGSDFFTQNTGGDTPHNTMQPSAVVLKIIKT